MPPLARKSSIAPTLCFLTYITFGSCSSSPRLVSPLQIFASSLPPRRRSAISSNSPPLRTCHYQSQLDRAVPSNLRRHCCSDCLQAWICTSLARRIHAVLHVPMIMAPAFVSVDLHLHHFLDNGVSIIEVHGMTGRRKCSRSAACSISYTCALTVRGAFK